MSEDHIYHEMETSLQNLGTFLACAQQYTFRTHWPVGIKDNHFENDKIISWKDNIEMEKLVFNTIFSPIEIENFYDTILDTCF